MSQILEDINVKRAGEQATPFVLVVPTAADEVYPVMPSNCPRMVICFEEGPQGTLRANRTPRETDPNFLADTSTYINDFSSRLTNGVPVSSISSRLVN